MARAQIIRFTILLIGLLLSHPALAGDVFTGYQIDNKGQYLTYLGVRAPLMKQQAGFEPFLQVFGAGLGYTFKDNGQERDANLQSVTPSLGVKYTVGAWSWLAMVGPQFRWKQEEQVTGPRSHDSFVGANVQLEAFQFQEQGIFHAIASYTDIDRFFFGRLRKTTLVHQGAQGCCSVYIGGDLAGMGNNQFYAAQLGPLIQVPVSIFYFTLKGGYQYTQSFHNGTYGGIELYFPF